MGTTTLCAGRDERVRRPGAARLFDHIQIVHYPYASGYQSVPTPKDRCEPDRSASVISSHQLHSLIIGIGKQLARHGEQSIVRWMNLIEVAVEPHESEELREVFFCNGLNNHRGNCKSPIIQNGHVRKKGSGIDGILLDIDGVLTVSSKPIPGAQDALSWLRSRGIPFRLLTNTTEESRRGLVQSLAAAGFDIEPGDLITAPVVTAAYLRSNHSGSRCLVIGAEASLEDLEGVHIVDEGGVVLVIGGTSESISWDTMNHALRMVLDGAPLIGMHRSMTWMTDDGMVMDAGVALLAALEEATDTEAVICGKPAPECFRQSLALMEVAPERAVMVGDDVNSDVLAAQAVGLTGILVKTGKFRTEALQLAKASPDHVIESIADLPPLLETMSA